MYHKEYVVCLLFIISSASQLQFRLDVNINAKVFSKKIHWLLQLRSGRSNDYINQLHNIFNNTLMQIEGKSG